MSVTFTFTFWRDLGTKTPSSCFKDSFFKFIDTFDKLGSHDQRCFFLNHLLQFFDSSFFLKAKLELMLHRRNRIDNFSLQRLITVLQPFKLLLKLTLVQFVQQSFIEFSTRDEILNHQLDTIHLLRLSHIKSDLQCSLQLFNRHLKDFLLNKVFINLDMVLLDINLHFSYDVLQLLDIMRVFVDFLLVDHGLTQLELHRGQRLIPFRLHVCELHRIRFII